MGVAKSINNMVRKFNKSIGLGFVNKLTKPFERIGEKIDDKVGYAVGSSMGSSQAPTPTAPAADAVEGEDISTSISMGRKRKGGNNQLARPIGTNTGSGQSTSTSVGLKV